MSVPTPRDLAVASARRLIAQARKAHPRSISQQLALLARTAAQMAPSKQGNHAECAAIPWEIVHAIRTIAEGAEP